MEPSQSDGNRKRLARSHEVFAAEAVDYFQQYYQFKPNEDKNYSYMTKATGDAITTISYLFRNETWKMCKDIKDFILEDDSFANYCRVIRVDGGNRFFYNYLRRVSLILEIASFCFMKGHDFFNLAGKYIGMYEYRDLQLFEERGGWGKLYRVAQFIGRCGDRLNMIMVKEEPTKKPVCFIESVGRLTPLYMGDDSNYCECFPYIVEIKWKLVIEETAGSLEEPESSSSSNGDDQNPPDARSRAMPSQASTATRELSTRRPESEERHLRPSTSRDSRDEVTTSKEAKGSRIQIEGDDEKAILDYLLRCCSKRKKFGHLGASHDSETSTTNSASTESEADNVREYGVIDSSDSDDEIKKSSQLQLVYLKEMRRKRLAEGSGSEQHGRGSSQSSSTRPDSRPHCSSEKIPRISNEPSKFMIAEETDTSTDEFGTTSDEKSEQSPQ